MIKPNEQVQIINIKDAFMVDDFFASKALILNDSRTQLLIVKNIKGLWSFPGGKRDDEETPTETLVRELVEELNVLVQFDPDSSFYKIGNDCLFAVSLPEKKVCVANEIVESRWIDIRKLKRYCKYWHKKLINLTYFLNKLNKTTKGNKYDKK